MKNDTSAILVGIEKLETSLEGFTGTSSGSTTNSESLIAALQVDLKPTLEAMHILVNETRQSQMKLDETIRDGVESIQRGIDMSAMNITDALGNRITTFESKMSESQKLIQDQVRFSIACNCVDNVTCLLGKWLHD